MRCWLETNTRMYISSRMTMLILLNNQFIDLLFSIVFIFLFFSFSIYDKLIEFCNIDEKGTMFDPVRIVQPFIQWNSAHKTSMLKHVIVVVKRFDHVEFCTICRVFQLFITWHVKVSCFKLNIFNKKNFNLTL